jgi:hypothetical protein
MEYFLTIIQSIAVAIALVRQCAEMDLKRVAQAITIGIGAA